MNLPEHQTEAVRRIILAHYGGLGLIVIVIFSLPFYIASAIYFKRKYTDDPFVLSHITYQLNTVWAFLIMMLIGVVTAYFEVGYAFILIATLFISYRTLRGCYYAFNSKCF